MASNRIAQQSRSAEARHLSQPAAPQAIDKLEAETGLRVFRRTSQGPIGKASDGLARAARAGRLRRDFQGRTDDAAGVLIIIGIGASAISRLPGGYAQNAPTSSAWAAAVEAGRLPVGRGHAMSAEDRLRAEMLEGLMCRFELDLGELAEVHGWGGPEGHGVPSAPGSPPDRLGVAESRAMALALGADWLRDARCETVERMRLADAPRALAQERQGRGNGRKA